MTTITMTKSLHTTIIRAAAPYLRVTAFLTGYEMAHTNRRLPGSTLQHLIDARANNGFAHRPAPILTPPDANQKLAKGATPSYGLTLAHADISGYEACLWRGLCTAVCVLNNGNGRYDATQRAWIWRTQLLAEQPIAALTIIGYELGKATHKHGNIMWRPNVNSDLMWHRILPNIRWAELGIQPYGYTKNPAILNTTGWINGFRYAYSVNENTDHHLIPHHLNSGGAIAIVTNRKPKHPTQPDTIRQHYGTPHTSVIDADTSDLWMLTPNTIGDLAAKGKAATQGGAFIQNIYP